MGLERGRIPRQTCWLGECGLRSNRLAKVVCLDEARTLSPKLSGAHKITGTQGQSPA